MAKKSTPFFLWISADLRARGAAASELCSGCPGPVGIPKIRGLGMEITGVSLNGHVLRNKNPLDLHKTRKSLDSHLTNGDFFDVGCRSWVSHPFWFSFEAHLLHPLCGHGQRDVSFLLHPSEGKLSVPL